MDAFEGSLLFEEMICLFVVKGVIDFFSPVISKNLKIKVHTDMLNGFQFFSLCQLQEAERFIIPGVLKSRACFILGLYFEALLRQGTRAEGVWEDELRLRETSFILAGRS
jgi:hypothetical protein